LQLDKIFDFGRKRPQSLAKKEEVVSLTPNDRKSLSRPVEANPLCSPSRVRGLRRSERVQAPKMEVRSFRR
jgi:hypothetical protein